MGCVIDGCEKPVRARGMCGMHYMRVRSHGNPHRTKYPTLEESFWSKVERRGVDECWLWRSTTDRAGYGVYDLPRPTKRAVRAHRLAYELEVGDIPDGLEIDHLCRVRNCVNPRHLEPVTRAENNRRRWDAWRAEHQHCTRGHPFDEANTYMAPDGQRICRACKAAWARRRRLERGRL